MFSFGAGQYGQLGHNSKSDETQPRKIMELMGTDATQIGKKTRQIVYFLAKIDFTNFSTVCGNKHTLVFVPTRGRVYAFGLGME